jgi:hypothetical protein
MKGGTKVETKATTLVPRMPCQMELRDSATWYSTHVSSTVLTTVLSGPLLL